jgi:hypothetical protein
MCPVFIFMLSWHGYCAGEPKAIPWSHVTPLRCAANAFFHQDVRPGDVVCWPTSIGWMLGPWLMFASLLNGSAVALFQGSPQGGAFGAFVQAAGVTMLGLVPSLVKVGAAAQRKGGHAGVQTMWAVAPGAAPTPPSCRAGGRAAACGGWTGAASGASAPPARPPLLTTCCG